MTHKIFHKDPDILNGTAVFFGTRVPIRILFDYLEAGDTLDVFLEDFPSVSREQATRLLQYALHRLTSGKQVARLEKKVEREKIVLAALPELSLQIVDFAREHGRVTIGEAIKLTGASRNTLKQHFRALVERGPPEPARLRLRGLVSRSSIPIGSTTARTAAGDYCSGDVVSIKYSFIGNKFYCERRST